MSIEETALFNVNIVLSNQPGDGELPDDEIVADAIMQGLNNWFRGVDVLSVSVVFRTGELE